MRTENINLSFTGFFFFFRNSAECKDSAETAKIVKGCPQNINEWVEAAKNEGSEKMLDSCSLFVYTVLLMNDEMKQ